jgi:hypothetical protein
MKYSKLREIADIKFCVVSPERMKKQETPSFWLSCSNFSEDNILSAEPSEAYYCPGSEMKINSGDIVIKRITPTYVNYISEISDDLYAGNNLIIVTAKENIYPKYLAAILNEKMPVFSTETSVGAVMKSISRPDLEAMTIPVIADEKQIAAGNLWFANIECKKMKARLAELEYSKMNYKIKHVFTIGGGKSHD